MYKQKQHIFLKVEKKNSFQNLEIQVLYCLSIKFLNSHFYDSLTVYIFINIDKVYIFGTPIHLTDLGINCFTSLNLIIDIISNINTD